MEQEDTNKKRTLEELCQDINLRAEKLYVGKRSKFILPIIAVVLLALAVLNRFFNWFECDNWYWIWLGAIVVWCFVLFIVNLILINGMKRAASPKQHLRIAKWLKRFVRFSNAFNAIILFLPFIRLACRKSYAVALFVAGLWFLFGYIAGPIDSAFSEDLDELEYRLSV